MTHDLTKMGNEELLDKFEEAARDKDYSHQRTVDDFWTLHAELLRRLVGLEILPKAQAALNLCCKALGDECRTNDWSTSGAESYKAYMQADDIVDEIEEFLDPESPQPPKKG